MNVGELAVHGVTHGLLNGGEQRRVDHKVSYTMCMVFFVNVVFAPLAHRLDINLSYFGSNAPGYLKG
jgi:S-adenosylmethionine synthetase